jgi:hypothetical protein
MLIYERFYSSIYLVGSVRLMCTIAVLISCEYCSAFSLQLGSGPSLYHLVYSLTFLLIIFFFFLICFVSNVEMRSHNGILGVRSQDDKGLDDNCEQPSVSQSRCRNLGVLGESLALDTLRCVPSICHVTVTAKHAINPFSRLGAGAKGRLITIPRVPSVSQFFFSFFLESAVHSRRRTKER